LNAEAKTRYRSKGRFQRKQIPGSAYTKIISREWKFIQSTDDGLSCSSFPKEHNQPKLHAGEIKFIKAFYSQALAQNATIEGLYMIRHTEFGSYYTVHEQEFHFKKKIRTLHNHQAA